MYDLIIKNGRIIDGLEKEAFEGDIGILNDRISEVGKLSNYQAKQVINAEGCMVCPGFIDMHSHSDLVYLDKKVPEAKIQQGITTELVGQDGLGPAPVKPDNTEMLSNLIGSLAGDPDINWEWNSFGEYLDALDSHGLPVNIAGLVTHGAARVSAMGMEKRKASEKELQIMENSVGQALKEGAVGLSTGLIYPPCTFSDEEELVRLNKVVARNKGVFVVHIRDEGTGLIEAIQEIVGIAETSGVRLHVSHLKAHGKAIWPKIDEVLRILSDGRKRGQIITADRYPYLGGSTFLGSLVPPWTLEGGNAKLVERLKVQEIRDRIKKEFELPNWTNRPLLLGWEHITVGYVRTEKNKKFEGKNFAAIAEVTGKSPADALFDLLIEEEGYGTMVTFFGHEDVLSKVLRYPVSTIGSDGIFGGKPHPRLYGSFPRVLAEYVREKGVLTMEEAVYKMTALPAKILNLKDRGVIGRGYYADIVVFDPSRIKDTATYDRPEQYPVGIQNVLVNGEVVIDSGNYTGLLPGRTLRHRID